MTPDASHVDERADLLREHDLKVTPQRLAILEVLASRDGHHPTAEDVHEALRARHPSVSLSTVYDTLSRFEELGIVGSFRVDDGAARYEYGNDPHVNVVCVECRSVVDVDTPAVSTLVDDVEDRTPFSLADQPVELRGRCDDCA